MTLRDEWLAHSLRISRTKADFYSGCRKILTERKLVFTQLDNSLQLVDAGYTKSKLTLLTGHYLHHESRSVAVELWNKRRGQAKYGSVGFTCYGHFVKGGSIDAKRSKRASVFGPCIQSVVITLLDKAHYSITVYYRTTEIFKKFPADLVLLRDVLLSPFNFEGLELVQVTCHFANITAHPMYFVTLIPSLNDPVGELQKIAERDPHFSQWAIKWTSRYTMDEYARGIAKFAQAQRVRMDARSRIKPSMMKKLNAYLKANHPGHRADYSGPEDDE